MQDCNSFHTYAVSFVVKWKRCLLISLHTSHCCCCLPASLRGEYYIALFFFYVFCKSCGEIIQAQSPPFVTDGKPFQRDYHVLDLLWFPFLLKPRYQWSVSCAGDPLDVSAHPSPQSQWNSQLWPFCLCHSQLSGNTRTPWWHLKCTCWTLLLPSP